jgi:hypothetical protein
MPDTVCTGSRTWKALKDALGKGSTETDGEGTTALPQSTTQVSPRARPQPSDVITDKLYRSALQEASSTIQAACKKHNIKSYEVSRLQSYMTDHMLRHDKGQAEAHLPDNVVPTAACINYVRDVFDEIMYPDWRSKPDHTWRSLDQALTDMWSHISNDKLPDNARERSNRKYTAATKGGSAEEAKGSMYRPALSRE